MTQATYRDEIDRVTEYDDAIREAMRDATCNADGEHSSPKYLRAELMERGLCIVEDVPVAWKVTVTDPAHEARTVFLSKELAARCANKHGLLLEPLYAAIK